MNPTKPHIFLRLITICLAAALMLPSVVKLSHIYADHAHVVCTSEHATHLHELDVDCEFYKFKIVNEYTFALYQSAASIFTYNTQSNTSGYSFICDFQKLPFSLRGPPFLV